MAACAMRSSAMESLRALSSLEQAPNDASSMASVVSDVLRASPSAIFILQIIHASISLPLRTLLSRMAFRSSVGRGCDVIDRDAVGGTDGRGSTEVTATTSGALVAHPAAIVPTMIRAANFC